MSTLIDKDTAHLISILLLIVAFGLLSLRFGNPRIRVKKPPTTPKGSPPISTTPPPRK